MLSSHTLTLSTCLSCSDLSSLIFCSDVSTDVQTWEKSVEGYLSADLEVDKRMGAGIGGLTMVSMDGGRGV